ncbi:MAG TPA: anti-sigma factor [Gaiellaceae bacterium]|nr:anti-sigma factor [Gaiellaceae bacterium]
MEAGIHELSAGYALDALDAHERDAFEAHLAECEQCQQELESFWTTTAALALAASGPEPAPALRERILADARAEPRSNVVSLDSRRRRLAPALGAVAAVAAVVALAVGLWASSISSELDDTRSALAQQQATAQILAASDAQSIALSLGEGRVVVSGDGDAVLVLDGIDAAPAGKTYEMWIVPDGDIGSANPAGLFSGADGTAIERLDGTVEPGDVVAVTIEDAGGVDAPTTDPIAASDPV